MILGLFGKCLGLFRERVAGATDARVRLVSEILSGMLLVKMLTWEDVYSQKMAEARRIEVREIQRKNWVEGLSFSFFEVASRVCVLFTFLTYVLTNHQLTVQAVSTKILNSNHFTKTLFFINSDIIWSIRCS